MTIGLSLLALCVGSVLAAVSLHRPGARGVLEALAGGLVVCGLSLLGICLPLFR